jgi:hypothetical protein
MRRAHPISGQSANEDPSQLVTDTDAYPWRCEQHEQPDGGLPALDRITEDSPLAHGESPR